MHQESYAEVEYCSEGRKNYDLLELVLPCASCLADQWLSMIQSIKNESKEIYCNRIIRIITVNINRWITWNRYCTQGDWKQLDSLYIGLTPCYHNIFWSHECRTVITNVSNTRLNWVVFGCGFHPGTHLWKFDQLSSLIC